MKKLSLLLITSLAICNINLFACDGQKSSSDVQHPFPSKALPSDEQKDYDSQLRRKVCAQDLFGAFLTSDFPRTLREFIAVGGDINADLPLGGDINADLSCRVTFLECAIKLEMVNVVTELIKYRPSLCFRCGRGVLSCKDTAVHAAAKHRNLNVLKAVLAHPDSKSIIDCEDCDGRTPLHCAAEAGCAGAAELLVVNGADLFVEGFYPSGQGCLIKITAKEALSRRFGNDRLENWLASRDNLCVAGYKGSHELRNGRNFGYCPLEEFQALEKDGPKSEDSKSSK